MTTLRFPEFLGKPLHDLCLGDVTEEATARNGNKLARGLVMGVRKEGGIVPMEERLVAGNIARYKNVQKNWFAYNPMRLNIGSIAQWQGDEEVLVSPDYVVFRCNPASLLPEYLDHFRSSRQWEAFTDESGDGGVRIRIYYRDIARMRLKLPDVSEQKKIADCLSSIDALISAEAEKLEALEDHKKGLMQQLFPAPGETTPRLRFPEFRGAGDWKEDQIGLLCNLYQAVTLSTSDLNQSGDYLVYGANGVIGMHDEYNHEESEVIVTCRGATCGEVTRTEAKSWINGNAMVVNPRVYEVSKDYIYHFLKRNGLKSVISGSAQPQITRIGLSPLLLNYPGAAEQQRIADCLSSIDALVAAQGSRIDALKVHKQGLMQQLFPVADQVQA